MPSAESISPRIATLLGVDVEHTTVITPNRRLAAALAREYNLAQQHAGRRVWATPDILPFSTFVERTYRALVLHDERASPSQLIDPSQSQLLWEQVIRKSDASQLLLFVPAAARQALSAWQLAHAWQLMPALRNYPLHEDAEAFVGWARRYQQILRERNLVDTALLPDALTQMLTEQSAFLPQLPRHILAAGFEIVPPQQQQFLRTLGGLGVALDTLAAHEVTDGTRLVRHEFASDLHEFRACAAWARECIQRDPALRIGVVVPSLREKRSQIERVFVDALDPMARAHLASTADQTTADQTTAALFNISLGVPLIDYALVNDAVSLIEFSLQREVSFLTVSRLLGSPFIAGAEQELAPRAALDAVLRKTAGSGITLLGLQKKLKLTHSRALLHARNAASLFCKLIDNVASMNEAAATSLAATSARGKSAARPTPPDAAQWMQHFSALLAAWGFPGERALDSIDYQVVAKFRAALQSLATLQVVQSGLRADEALAYLRRVLQDTVFQPESGGEREPPIQILGILESAGQAFDRLWVTGLSEDAWPLAVQPNPFIPISLQRRAGVPESSAATSLALDQRITIGWRRAAARVVFSHARHEGDGRRGDQARRASAFIRDLPADEFALTISPRYAEALQAENGSAPTAARDDIPDQPLTALPAPTRVYGGASLIRDQAACPFRAFARHRLAATPLERPGASFDAAERGTLVHRVMALVWTSIGAHATLLAMSADEMTKLVRDCVHDAIIEARQAGQEHLVGRFATLEHDRLCRLATDWLVIERSRQPFTVEACEQSVQVQLGPLAMSLRLDRRDRLVDGTQALIDYKTGNAMASSWLGERPDEPQLPMYCRTSTEHVSVLAFARLKRGKNFGFEGVSAAHDVLPGVTPIEDRPGVAAAAYPSWDVLVQHWERTLDDLAVQFAQGEATIDPKHGAKTCKQCDLHAVCRIAEWSGQALASDDDKPSVDAGLDEGSDA